MSRAECPNIVPTHTIEPMKGVAPLIRIQFEGTLAWVTSRQSNEFLEAINRGCGQRGRRLCRTGGRHARGSLARGGAYSAATSNVGFTAPEPLVLHSGAGHHGKAIGSNYPRSPGNAGLRSRSYRIDWERRGVSCSRCEAGRAQVVPRCKEWRSGTRRWHVGRARPGAAARARA
jgi:hypothetical protein